MKSATKHWFMARFTAILLTMLSYWLLKFLQLCLQANYFEIIEWLSSPINKIALLSWFLVACYHSALGLQVVFEDYISNRSRQFFAIWTSYSFFAILALITLTLIIQN